MYYYVIELWVDKEDEYRQDLFQKYLFIDCVTVETRSVDKLIRPQREIDKRRSMRVSPSSLLDSQPCFTCLCVCVCGSNDRKHNHLVAMDLNNNTHTLSLMNI